MLGLPNDLTDSSLFSGLPNLDPTICICDCHEDESDLSRTKKMRMVRHVIPCCMPCSHCGALIMNHGMEMHLASYCVGNKFDNRKV